MVAAFAVASVSRPVSLSGEVAVRTGTEGSTSGDRTTGVAITSTSSAGATVGTPLAASTGVLSSVVVGGDTEVEAETESLGGGGSGRDCKFA